MPRLRVQLFDVDESSIALDERMIDGATVMLGRGTDCDWVLDDPGRRLSRHHCSLQASKDGAFVTDLSSNGIFLNGADTRLARGEPQRLSGGDRIEMGDYALVISVEEAADSEPKARSDDPVGVEKDAGEGAAPFDAFLSGAGLDALQLDGAQGPDALYTAGRVFRRFVDNLHDLLSDRSAMKAQFRAEQTLVSTANPNPFKTFRTDDLLVRILSGDAPEAMPSEVAVEDAFRDVKRHQMALLSAMHSALFQLLERLNPDEIEQLLDNKSAMSIVTAGGKKAAAWDAYQAHFEEIERDIANLDSSRFMADFRQGYEARLRELDDAED